MRRIATVLTAAFVAIPCSHAPAAGKPLKVYILAGQSNMQGLGIIAPATTPGTLEYTVANDPDKAYQFLVDADGKWVVRDDVRIRYISKHGGLTPGYGGGHDARARVHRPGTRLRSPCRGSAGESRPDHQGFLGRQEPRGRLPTAEFGRRDRALLQGGPATRQGNALAICRTYVPDYQGQGYEIAGFAWHQGWNDRINPKFTAEYAENMANFIRDMRKDLGVPNLPFVIATTGMDGEKRYTDLERRSFRWPTRRSFPEFAGNVSVIDTRAGGYDGMDFWQDADMSPSAGGTHWNKNAKTYLNMGIAMADAMLLMAPGRCPFRLRAKGGAER